MTIHRLRVSMLSAAVLILGPAAAFAATVSTLVPGGVIHAIEGIDVDETGTIYGTSIHGQAVYRIDPKTGHVEIAVGHPDGESDDVSVGRRGTPVAGILAWTAQSSGEIRILRPGGKPETVLRNVPRVNPIAFGPNNRLYTAQAGAGDDSLWEIDVLGNQPPRVILKQRLNGFGFGPDGRLYGPWFGTDKLVAIDVAAASVTTVISGVGAPAAVKVSPRGEVFSVDYLKGDLWQSDPKTGTSKIVASVREPLDNLAIAADGTVYVSNVADSSVIAIDPKTGAARDIVRNYFTIALGATMARLDGREMVLVADTFGYRYVDPASGKVTRPPWAGNRGASSAVAASDRYIAFSYSISGRVKKIDRQTDQVVFDSNAIKTPRGVALNAAGDVIVADADGGRLMRVDASGAVPIATGLKRPVGLILEDETHALVTEFDGGTVSRVDLTSGARTELASGLKTPNAVARTKDGRLIVTDPSAGQVIAIGPKSGARKTLANGLPLSFEGLELAHDTNIGVAVGSDGAIYVTCPGDNRVVKIIE